jgi:PIN domain nuclease of toxin-antitoxin system
VGERVVLDAFAVLALLGDEPGAEDVAVLPSSDGFEFHVSAVNVGELMHILHRRFSPDAARAAEDAIYDHPRIRVAEATRDRIRAAAVLKAQGGISFADAFAAALAQEVGGPLVSGDPEFQALEGEALKIRWLPRR